MLTNFLSGAISMGFFISALFFLRFWSRTRESLFLTFALAFVLLGLVQALLSLGNIAIEERSWIYLLRLAAFLLIIASIVKKNEGR